MTPAGQRAKLSTRPKTLSFNYEYCNDVLNRIAEEFNTKWAFQGKTVHLRKVEKTKTIRLC